MARKVLIPLSAAHMLFCPFLSLWRRELIEGFRLPCISARHFVDTTSSHNAKKSLVHLKNNYCCRNSAYSTCGSFIKRSNVPRRTNYRWLSLKATEDEATTAEAANLNATRIGSFSSRSIQHKNNSSKAMASTEKDHYYHFNNAGAGDIILTSEAEYAANIVAMQRAAEERRASVVAVPSIEGTGTVKIEAFQDMLEMYKYQISMVCMTHIPTNSGIVNPLEQIGSLIDDYNKKGESSSSGDGRRRQILYLVDACQSVGQRVVDVQALHCDALSATGRKYLRGPRGTGFLYVSPHLTGRYFIEQNDEKSNSCFGISPAHIDHSSASVVRVPSIREDTSSPKSIQVEYKYASGARRFEFWESAPANRLGLGAAVHYAFTIGLDVIQTKCSERGRELQKRLSHIRGVEIYYSLSARQQAMVEEERKGKAHATQPPPEQCGIVTFTLSNTDPIKVKALLDQKYNFTVSVVPATSTPLDSAQTRTSDLVRASLSYFNTVEEIDDFVNAVRDIALGAA